MRSSVINISTLIIGNVLLIGPVSAKDVPSTATFMNVMTVCGAGSTIKIDADLQGSLASVYDREATKGRAIQEILPEVAKILPDGANYEKYLECVKTLLLP